MDSTLLQSALRLVGAELAEASRGRVIRLSVVGGAAGMLAGRLRGSRTTADECRFVEDHLDRLSSEHLDRDTFDDQRAVLRAILGDAR